MAKKVSRDRIINIRTFPKTQKALDEAARDMEHTRARMAEIILQGWLRQEGYLEGRT